MRLRRISRVLVRYTPSYSMMPRLVTAMLTFGALALLAAVTLDGLFRLAVWIFLAGLAVKTWIASRMP